MKNEGEGAQPQRRGGKGGRGIYKKKLLWKRVEGEDDGEEEKR